MNAHTQTMKHAADFAAVTTAGFSFLGWLPPISAALSILWLSIQIIEWVLKKRRRA